MQGLPTNIKIHIQKENGDFVELKNVELSLLKQVELALRKQEEQHTHVDVPFTILSIDRSFSFKMGKNTWYSALGLIVPMYKRFRKGKRYILKEVIEWVKKIIKV